MKAYCEYPYANAFENQNGDMATKKVENTSAGVLSRRKVEHINNYIN